MKGWWKEYHRHSLAARGILTSRYMVSKRYRIQSELYKIRKFGGSPEKEAELQRQLESLPRKGAPGVGGYTPAKLKPFETSAAGKGFETLLLQYAVNLAGQPGFEYLGDRETAVRSARRLVGLNASPSRPSIADDLAALTEERRPYAERLKKLIERRDAGDDSVLGEIESLREKMKEFSKRREELGKEREELIEFFKKGLRPGERGFGFDIRPQIPPQLFEIQKDILDSDIERVEADLGSVKLSPRLKTMANDNMWSVREAKNGYQVYLGNAPLSEYVLLDDNGHAQLMKAQPVTYKTSEEAVEAAKKQLGNAKKAAALSKVEAGALAEQLSLLKSEREALEGPQFFGPRRLAPRGKAGATTTTLVFDADTGKLTEKKVSRATGTSYGMGIITYVTSNTPLRQRVLADFDRSINKRLNAMKYATAQEKKALQQEIEGYRDARAELIKRFEEAIPAAKFLAPEVTGAVLEKGLGKLQTGMKVSGERELRGLGITDMKDYVRQQRAERERILAQSRRKAPSKQAIEAGVEARERISEESRRILGLLPPPSAAAAPRVIERGIPVQVEVPKEERMEGGEKFRLEYPKPVKLPYKQLFVRKGWMK